MSQSVGVLGLDTCSYVVLHGFVIVLNFFVPIDARNILVLVQHWCVRVWSDILDQRVVVTPLIRCPRGRCRPGCDDKPCGLSQRFLLSVSNLFHEVLCQADGHISFAHCFEVALFVSSFEGQGFPCPDCDSNNSRPLLVVCGRAESQLSLDVMVHKARLSQLS